MKTWQGVVAVLEVALLAPAALFMMAVFMQGAFTHPKNAEALAGWYAARMWTLWLLLVALPFAALIMGGLTLLRPASLQVMREHLATFCVAASTLAAAAILAIVVLHMAAN
jgi:hypothetical protein